MKDNNDNNDDETQTQQLGNNSNSNDNQHTVVPVIENENNDGTSSSNDNYNTSLSLLSQMNITTTTTTFIPDGNILNPIIDLSTATTTNNKNNNNTDHTTFASSTNHNNDIAGTNNDQNSNINNIISSVIPNPNSIPRIITRSYELSWTKDDDGNNNPIIMIPLHLIIHYYADCIFVGISQSIDGRIGTYLLCQNDIMNYSTDEQQQHAAMTSSSSTSGTRQEVQSHLPLHITHLLGIGRDDPLLSVYSRHIYQNLIGPSSTTSLLLGILLDPKIQGQHDRMKMFHTIIPLIQKLFHELLE